MAAIIPKIGGVPSQTQEVDAGSGQVVLNSLARQAFDDITASLGLISGSFVTKTLSAGDSTTIGDGVNGFNSIYVSVKGDATNNSGYVVIGSETDDSAIRDAMIRYDFDSPVTTVLLAMSKTYTSDRYALMTCTGYE